MYKHTCHVAPDGANHYLMALGYKHAAPPEQRPGPLRMLSLQWARVLVVVLDCSQETNKMTLRDFYLKRAKAEFPVFLKVLRAFPSDLSYKPDERSPSAEQLVWTVTYELKALIDVVETGKCEWQNITPPGLDEMIGMYEKWSTELLDKVAALDDVGQLRNAQFLYQGTVVMEKPMVEFLWDFMFDAIHHRGQLSAYLRPMGGKVPSIYGPSADDTGM